MRGVGLQAAGRRRRAVSRIPIRFRLTLAFTAVMALVLVAVGLFVYSRVSSDLNDALDTSLRARADDLAAAIPAGRRPRDRSGSSSPMRASRRSSGSTAR